MSTADKLTWSRVAMVPVMAALMYISGTYTMLIAAAVYVLAGVTDILDGYFARKEHTVSDFGKLMDPIADKLITLAALFILIEKAALPAWVGIVIVGREILIDGVRMLVLNGNGKVVAASTFGKLKTVFQDIAITMFMLQGYLVFIKTWYVGWVFMAVALFFTLWSTWDYCFGAYKVLHGGKKA